MLICMDFKKRDLNRSDFLDISFYYFVNNPVISNKIKKSIDSNKKKCIKKRHLNVYFGSYCLKDDMLWKQNRTTTLN